MITTMNIVADELIKEMNYKGCKNCANQIAPLRMCEWAELGGDGQVHFICPRWEERGDKVG